LTGLTSRRPFTLLGILLAVLVIGAFVLVALNAGQGTQSSLLTVVVATKDLQPRLPIDATSLELRQVPYASDPKVYFTRIQDVQGMIPLVTIGTGQVVTSNDIAQPSQALGAQSEYLPIPTGFVAMTIPTSEQDGVGYRIQPDDYISVIATLSNGSKQATLTVFTNLHVIKVGTPGAESGNASSLTVVVTQCQAQLITWFLANASLKYTLEAYPDYLKNQAPDPKCPSVVAAASGPGVTLETINGVYPALATAG
jgi:Flp pilus assembly protein CpaB